MLDFIVLGEIPGTSIQLSFSDIARFVTAALLIILCSQFLRIYRKTLQK